MFHLRRFTLLLLCFVSLDLLAQTCRTQAEVPATTPDAQLIAHGNGTVSDITTGLMWKQCNEGLSGSDCATGSVETLTWQQALQRPETLNVSGGFAGYTDWRLPNIKELQSLVEEQCYEPSINLHRFPNTSSRLIFWSSSAASFFGDYAWYVYFGTGESDYDFRNYAYAVRLVRGGTNEQVPPEISASPRVVQTGGNSTLSWNTNNWNEINCIISGGGLTENPLLSNGGDRSTGSISLTVNAMTTYTLTCGTLSVSVTVEVIGSGSET